MNKQAPNDISTLDSLPRLIISLRTRALTPHEVYQLKMLDMFVTELVRLAHCAIKKASSKQEVRITESIASGWSIGT